jgi:hypothetical protein
MPVASGATIRSGQKPLRGAKEATTGGFPAPGSSFVLNLEQSSASRTTFSEHWTQDLGDKTL